MNRVVLDVSVLRRNLRRIADIMDANGAAWTLVTKILCGYADALRELPGLGVITVGDTRLENLQAVRETIPRLQSWYLRPPHVSAVDQIVELADVSLDTEVDALEALDEAARRLDRRHSVVIMVELGDLREGVLPGSLLSFFRHAVTLRNVHILGIGANIGCLSGTVPTQEQLSPLLLYRRLLEHEFDLALPIVSAGSSVVLSALLQGNVPAGINHYRIGEAAFLGTDLIRGGLLEGFENAVTIEAEIIEIKEKNLSPIGEIAADIAPFDTGAAAETEPGERGHRALVGIGQVDTEVRGLVPLDPDQTVVGASSDISVVNLGENAADLEVGDRIRFRADYSAVVRAMSSKYLRRELVDPERRAEAPASVTGFAPTSVTEAK